ncbi:chloramphenicol acetyltransferase [Mucilaginibacter segetis]|uniref:Chloramphenicol acetyltransferase n=1 Tax=Mucilaginibacter segetis TaxID=2793071 RepID=A0A934PUC2_9SPHI|nr:chloramphenicol acetyltransferase [Mucilaginibacter segetis]MBK0379545.1 chloramphenicol acetyltransferase [Mucilaginibacter segetis]
MKAKIDMADWPRKDHFNFFNKFEEPFFGVTVNVDCTDAYERAKRKGASFFLYYLYASLTAVNNTEAFRYRIIDDEVYLFDVVHASSTVNRPDGTFGFSYIDFKPTFDEFAAGAKAEIERIQNTTGLIPSSSGENVIHYSAIPWIDFTSLTHARSFSFKDSVPKISFGKITENNSRKLMPVSITVHHGLMDGLHVANYVDLFQELLNNSDQQF